MKAKEEKRLRELFATKTGGKLYQLYYEGRMYRQKEGGEVLLSKHNVMEMLGIDYDSYSKPEKAFIDRLWNGAIGRFQRRAWDMMQPWGTLRVRHRSGATVWLHGYTMDPAKQESMQKNKHYLAVGHYIAEKKQQKAFSIARGDEDGKQIELPVREEITSFYMPDSE